MDAPHPPHPAPDLGQGPPSPARGEGGVPEPTKGGGALRRGSRRPAKGADVDWVEVRRAYELTDEPVPSIQQRFGVTAYQMRRHREAEQWTLRDSPVVPGPMSGYKPIGVERVAYR